MAFVAFDIPPVQAPSAQRSVAITITPAMPRQRGQARRPVAAIAARAAVALATLLVLSVIAWNVSVETDSILIGLGAADIAFLIAMSLGLSLHSASRSARRR